MNAESYLLSGTDLTWDSGGNKSVTWPIRSILIGSAPIKGAPAEVDSNLIWRVEFKAGKISYVRQFVTAPGAVVPFAVETFERFAVTLLADPAPNGWQGAVTVCEGELVYPTQRQLWPERIEPGEWAVPAGATTVHIVNNPVNVRWRSTDAAGNVFEFNQGTPPAGATLNVRGSRIVVGAQCNVVWEIQP